MSISFDLINGIAAAFLAAGALGALFCRRCDRLANWIGCAGVSAAILLKLTIAFSSGVLSGIFQLPILLVGLAAALHSCGYMQNHGKHRMSVYWFLFNVMIFAMLAVTMLGRGFAFLAAWELMGLSSFALVAFEWKKRSVVRASWIYLLACEAGGLLLIWLLVNQNSVPLAVAAAVTTIAFGLKAGFPLLHVWLPEAHPAAPAPVSAVMSAAMIPLGFYGIFAWCPEFMATSAAGWIFFAMGIIGMLVGILFGAAQRDLKRLLAYSSVENIGIITLAVGLGLLGVNCGNDMMMALGFTGAMLHVINHALLKGTLFLGAGSVYKAMHTLNMDEMGGLVKKMPWTASIFTVSALGISGLPPFCGFAGELLIYMAAFHGIAAHQGAVFAGCVAAVIALALTGGMAAAAFAKSIAAVFAGEPRSQAAVDAPREQQNMVVPVFITGLAAIFMTWAAPWIAADVLINVMPEVNNAMRKTVFELLAYNGLIAFAMLILTMLLLWMRLNYCRRQDSRGLTWDCGYAQPTARMQYTASAFIQPLADLFNGILRQKKDIVKPESLFPDHSSIAVSVPDGGSRWLWGPLSQLANNISNRVKHLQSGLLHVYILIMVLAIILMLLAGFLFAGKSAAGENVKQTAVAEVNHE